MHKQQPGLQCSALVHWSDYAEFSHSRLHRRPPMQPLDLVHKVSIHESVCSKQEATRTLTIL